MSFSKIVLTNVDWQRLPEFKNYVSSKLREGQTTTHTTMVEKLPAFIKEAKHRAAIIKVIVNWNRKLNRIQYGDFSQMKHLTILLLCSLITNRASSQSHHAALFLGKYEGIESRYYKGVDDTSKKVNRIDKAWGPITPDSNMNKRWGTKQLTLDSNGTFLLEFPVPYPTSRICPPRSSRGRWLRIKDTLILNSYYSYSDFMKIRERKVNRNRIEIKLKYIVDGKSYYPNLEISINNHAGQMSDTRHPWTHLPLDTVRILEIKKYAGPNSTEREWVCKPAKRNSNYFVITLIDNIEGNNFVVEDYKLLISDSSLVQIDQLFNLSENRFKAASLR